MATPTICRPCEPYSFCRSINQGISILQGPHQVAQKLRRTALPRKSERRVILPSRDSREKSGAGVAWVIGGGSVPRRAMCNPTKSIPATTIATTTSARGLWFFCASCGGGSVDAGSAGAISSSAGLGAAPSELSVACEEATGRRVGRKIAYNTNNATRTTTVIAMAELWVTTPSNQVSKRARKDN